jgi:hypothetical protein
MAQRLVKRSFRRALPIMRVFRSEGLYGIRKEKLLAVRCRPELWVASARHSLSPGA